MITAITASAGALAVRVASCSAAGLTADHLLRDVSPEQLRALVGILAAAADPVRLRAVTQAPAGLAPEDRTRFLRRAHAEFTRLVRAGKPVPLTLRDLDGEYRADARRRKPGAPKPPPGAVASVIRQRRRDAGMSQQALAAAAGVSQSCLSLYESGARTPRAKTWRQLELTLGPLGVVREQVKTAATKDDHAAAA